MLVQLKLPYHIHSHTMQTKTPHFHPEEGRYADVYLAKQQFVFCALKSFAIIMHSFDPFLISYDAYCQMR